LHTGTGTLIAELGAAYRAGHRELKPNQQEQFMRRNILKQTTIAIAISAASGLAFAQATHPAAGSHTTKTDDSAKTSGKIISDQTQAPNKAMSKDGSASSRSGEGAGASNKTAGQIIDKQTHSAGKAKSGSSASDKAMKGDPSTKTSADIIKNETESPGRTGTTGQPPRSSSSGTTR
jgi:hypothetical protein